MTLLAAKSDSGDIAQVIFFVLFVVISAVASWVKNRSDQRKRAEATRRRQEQAAGGAPAREEPEEADEAEDEAGEERPQPVRRDVAEWVRRERERLRERARQAAPAPAPAPAPVFEEVPEPHLPALQAAFMEAHPETGAPAAFVDPRAVARRGSASPSPAQPAARPDASSQILPPAVEAHLTPAQRAIAYSVVIGPCAARAGPPHRQAQKIAPPPRPRRPRGPKPPPPSEAPPAP